MLLPLSLQRIINTACDILVLEIHSPQWPHKRHLCVLHPPVTFLHNLAAAESSVPSALSSSLFFPPTHHAQAESLHSTCYPSALSSPPGFPLARSLLRCPFFTAAFPDQPVFSQFQLSLLSQLPNHCFSSQHFHYLTCCILVICLLLVSPREWKSHEGRTHFSLCPRPTSVPRNRRCSIYICDLKWMNE